MQVWCQRKFNISNVKDPNLGLKSSDRFQVDVDRRDLVRMNNFYGLLKLQLKLL